MLNLNKLVTVVNEAQSRVKSVAKLIINSQFGNKSSKSSNWDSEADFFTFIYYPPKTSAANPAGVDGSSLRELRLPAVRPHSACV